MLQRSTALIAELRATHPGQESELTQQEVEAASWLAELEQQQSRYDDPFHWHAREVSALPSRLKAEASG